MKKLLFISIAVLIISCTTEESEPLQNCTKSYYTWEPIGYSGGTWIYGYKFQYSEPTTLPETNGYVTIDNSNYYKVECE